MAEGEVDEVVSKQLEQLHIQETSTGAPEAAEPIAGERRKGTVRWFNASKGFGFIQPEGAEGDTEDLFVHQTSIQAEGFRSLREAEPVEYDLEAGEDGRAKAVKVTGPNGAPPLGAPRRISPAQQAQQYGAYEFPPQAYGYPPMVAGFGRARGGRMPGRPPAMGAYGMMAPPDGRGGGRGGGRFGMQPMPMPGYMPGYPMPMGIMDRPPPPGTPGVSSGLQVVVHNLPWTCTWQQLKDAFVEAGVANVERADVIIDSGGRSRGFGVVSFPTQQEAMEAVEKTNGVDIGGRTVTVRIDRFA